jgi:hypothetical protein
LWLGSVSSHWKLTSAGGTSPYDENPAIVHHPLIAG